MQTINHRQLVIGRILRYGLWFSVLIVLIGGVFYLSQNGHALIHYQQFQLTPQPLSLLTILSFPLNFTPTGIIQLGLFLLVFTQVLRVMMVLWLFIQEKDIPFIFISFFILIVLSYSVFWR